MVITELFQLNANYLVEVHDIKFVKSYDVNQPYESPQPAIHF